MTKIICIAPTNEPDTCRVCGIALKPARIYSASLDIAEATEEQLKEWPRNPVWVTDEFSGVAHFHGVYFADHQRAYLPSEHKGLDKYAGSWQNKTNVGDGHFCSVACAVAFARIAANAGLRLPSVTPKQRRELRRNHRVVVALCREVLDPSPSVDPDGRTIKREGKLTPRGRRFRHGNGPELWVYRSGKLCRNKWDSAGVSGRVEDKSAPLPESLDLPAELKGQVSGKY